jgi:hypothetical protein
MSKQHTPAPWRIGSNGATTKVVDADGKAVCMLTYRKDCWNGDLIAAAPELLELARQIVLAAEQDEGEIPSDIVAGAKAAIAKATEEDNT